MKTTSPRDRMGVYKRIEQVPDERRLNSFAGSYKDRDMWAEFLDVDRPHRYQNWDHYKTKLERAGRRWKDHMDEQGRHHALAQPDDVEAWSQSLLDELTEGTAYRHWCQVEKFYTWLQYHIDHPHTYQPVWMAVAEHDDGAAGRLWNRKLGDSSE